MYWNYRFVKVNHELSTNGGEHHIALQEVHYDNDGTIIGVCDPCTFCDSVEELPLLKEHIMLAWDNPVLHESELPTGNDAVIVDGPDDSLAWLKDAMTNGLTVKDIYGGRGKTL